MTEDLFVPPLSRAFPSQINVDVTEFCNLACRHCPYETVIKPKGKNRLNLSEDLHRRMVDQIRRDGAQDCRFIRYTGEGEPLLHPRLIPMLADAAERTGIAVTLTTNGLLLNQERIEGLVKAGVAVFDISLDAFSQPVYGGIRVGGILEQAVAGTRALIAAAHAAPIPAKVMVSFVVQPDNQHEAAAFESFWREAGVDHVAMRPRHSCAGSMDEVSAAMWRQAPSPRTPCLYPWERLVVKPDGTLAYCPADWKQEAVVGSLAEGDDIAAVWSGPAMTTLRAAHQSGDFSAHSFCGKCPDWSMIRWPDQGWGYARIVGDLVDKGR